MHEPEFGEQQVFETPEAPAPVVAKRKYVKSDKERAPVDSELSAIRKIGNILFHLTDNAARKRVLSYATTLAEQQIKCTADA